MKYYDRDRHIGRSNQIAGRELTQLVAQQFSGRALRQFVPEFNMSRVLVWRDPMFYELLQFEREIRSSERMPSRSTTNALGVWSPVSS
jgi:hypothetical protein